MIYLANPLINGIRGSGIKDILHISMTMNPLSYSVKQSGKVKSKNIFMAKSPQSHFSRCQYNIEFLVLLIHEPNHHSILCVYVPSDEQLPGSSGRIRSAGVAARSRRPRRLPGSQLAGPSAGRVRLSRRQRRLRASRQPPAFRIPRDRSQPRTPQLHPGELNVDLGTNILWQQCL